jgi:hypothetical protein
MTMDDAMQDSGSFPQYVFKDGVRFRYLKKDGATKLYLMPSRPNERSPEFQDLLAWVPYRGPDDKFTSWIQPYKVYRFLSGRPINVIAPATFGEIRDPIMDLYKAAKSSPKYMAMAGLLPDGKRDPNAFKNKTQLIRPPDTMFIVNGVNPEAEVPENNQCCVYSLPKTAISASRPEDGSGWGLIGKLEQAQRGVDGSVPQNDFARRFFWGDITDPRNLVLCQSRKAKAPQGGADLYDLEPKDGFNRQSTREMLETRYILRSEDPNLDVFLHMSQAEYLDIVFSLFGDYPDLLRLAYDQKIPGIQTYFDKYHLSTTAVPGFTPPPAPMPTLDRSVQQPIPQPAMAPAAQAVGPAPITTPPAHTFVPAAPPVPAAFAPPVAAASAFQAPAPAAPAAGSVPIPPAPIPAPAAANNFEAEKAKIQSIFGSTVSAAPPPSKA